MRCGKALLCAASAGVTNINGHRALLLGPKLRGEPQNPVLLLGGTAQWLDSWMGHLSALARTRQVLLYETRGQGGKFADGSLSLEDATLPQHAEDLEGVVRASGLAESAASGAIDVVAFSFGARVAMRAAAGGSLPVRRMCVTGVSADRGPRGRLALQSWRAALRAGDDDAALRAFVWRLLLDTYSPATLAKSEASVPGWVDAVLAANSLDGVRAIVEQTHQEDPTDPCHPLAMAQAIRESKAVAAGLLINGAEDLLCPGNAGQALAEAGGFGYATIEGAGHAAPIEQPLLWRKQVVDFLDHTP